MYQESVLRGIITSFDPRVITRSSTCSDIFVADPFVEGYFLLFRFMRSIHRSIEA